MVIRAEVTAWRERSEISYDRSDNAPAVQKFELPPPSMFPPDPPSPQQVEENHKNNGIWINPASFKLLLTGQEAMTMTRGEVRALVAARKAGTAPLPALQPSEEAQRFHAAATAVRERIRTIMSLDGYDPGAGMTFGMFDGKPRLNVDYGHGARWIDAPNNAIGQMIKDLWKTRS